LRTATRRYRPQYSNPKPLEQTQNWIKLGGKVIWHALNSSVRPFTAKWHPLSDNGGLDALDSSDDFRAELYHVQDVLRELERALALLEGVSASYRPGAAIEQGRVEELPPEARWRPAGGDAEFMEPERDAVRARRRHYEIDRDEWAAGIALSGGGIRSATFSLGVLAALARKNLLPEFDYLSTVSGGGYAGCFLTSLIGRDNSDRNIGLGRSQEPFKRTEQESDLLMGVRQRASFLSGSLTERLLLVMRSTYGVFVNVFILFAAIAVFAATELGARVALNNVNAPSWLGWTFPFLALIILGFISRQERLQLNELTRWHLLLGAMFCLPLVWIALGAFHSAISWLTGTFVTTFGVAELSATFLVGTISIAFAGAVSAVYANARSFAVAVLTAALLLLGEQAFFAFFSEQPLEVTAAVLAVIALALALLWLVVDVNETSLYRYYRSKLATAFIYEGSTKARPQLSSFVPRASLYPIVNCALNAPGSDAPKMRGRLADVFSFTPLMTGSNLLGYHDTTAWEQRNPGLDLAAVMALSGAAVSPQMGLRTSRRASFWLTLFNARLHAWLRKPDGTEKGQLPKPSRWWQRGVGLRYLVHEFMATANEKLPFVNISDGGHIENLGVYELLRRRCRYIVVVDGESDPRMTFHALTNLQRLAYIDFGIQIDAELDELRLLESGFSRSHFRFCKIRYPTGDEEQPWEVGYLLYVKLSLTGNEGEFLKRYRLDEPSFPHHSTADQFFTETQFEAYRSLGEHIGDRLFMEAIIEDLAKEQSIEVEAWMKAYAKNFG
ncbi:patatin-like phospholipase family protein, partial [Ensifer adhaerens]|uniref:patatin-like phospholipase family protein n=1 Tax=Ensifer adhaerens TaxID=106592 RepID=UPI003850A370